MPRGQAPVEEIYWAFGESTFATRRSIWRTLGLAGWRDASLLADLAFARLHEGRTDEARRLARRAAALQPASPSVRQIERLVATADSPNAQ